MVCGRKPDEAVLLKWPVRNTWSGLVWSSVVIWIQEVVWSSGLLEKIGPICGKEKEKSLPNSLLLKCSVNHYEINENYKLKYIIRDYR